MTAPQTLSREQTALMMESLPFWKAEGSAIVREIAAAGFVPVVAIVNAVAVLAEKHGHYPDLLIYGWNKLRITITTHDRGSLTDLDFRLAGEIENLGLF